MVRKLSAALYKVLRPTPMTKHGAAEATEGLLLTRGPEDEAAYGEDSKA